MQLQCLGIFLAVAASILLPRPATAQTQAEMNQQTGEEYVQADERLNAVYAELRAKISEQGRTSLQQAEQAWVRFRDAECSFETMGSEDGSDHPLAVALCKLRLTKQRTKDLHDQAHCAEGDIGCGGQ